MNQKIKIGSNIKIKDKKDIKIINNIFVCTNQQLDYICIEIFDNENFEDYFIIVPDINCDNPFENYKDDLIVIMQYPGNKGLLIAEGKIIGFKNDKKILFILFLLNLVHLNLLLYYHRNLNIIGIHLEQLKDYNKGVYFKSVLEDIKNNIPI